MKKTLLILPLTLGILFSSGCVSYNSLKKSKEQVAIRKAISANNQNAIQALRSGSSPQEAGIKVGTWEAINERPLLQAGSAIADALIVWGGIEGVQWLSEGSSSDNDREEQNANSGRDAVNVEVNGDGNTVQVRGDENNIGSPESEGSSPFPPL